MPSDVQYSREIRYQLMRAIRTLGLILYPIVIGIVGVYAYFCILDCLDMMKPMLTAFSRYAFGPSWMNAGYEYWNQSPNDAAFLKLCFKHFAIVGLGFMTIAALFAVYNPYACTPNMPTYKIRHCKHCGAALSNHNWLRCHSCNGRYPSGLILAMIRGFGVALMVGCSLFVAAFLVIL